MEHRLFFLLFLTGVVLSVPHKYYLMQQGTTWKDAQTYCRAKHIDLATIESDEDMIKIHNEGQKYGLTSSTWIGLYNNIKLWHWTMGNELVGSWTGWDTANGEPTGGPNDEFGAIGPSGWFDDQDSGRKAFMCYNATQTGSNRYILISNAFTWWGGLNYCRRYHTDLASVRDADEHATILGKIQSNTWIGLRRGVWTWSDKTDLSTSSWMQLPDFTYQLCGYLSKSVAYTTLCTDIKPFFCHRVITAQQQIIRMKVQSDQDVNDPAVKAAILEQIQKKLMNHGVAEKITVKWREQPDGKVFHIVRQKGNAVEDKTMKKCSTENFIYG